MQLDSENINLNHKNIVRFKKKTNIIEMQEPYFSLGYISIYILYFRQYKMYIRYMSNK